MTPPELPNTTARRTRQVARHVNSGLRPGRRSYILFRGTVQPTHLVAALERTAGHLGIEVRYEPIERTSTSDPGGGLCRLRGQPVVVVDARLGATDRAAILARALAAFGVLRRAVPPRARAAMSADVRAAIQIQAARLDEELAKALGRRQAVKPRQKFRRGLHCVDDTGAPLAPVRAAPRAESSRPACETRQSANGQPRTTRAAALPVPKQPPKPQLRPLARARPK